MTVAFDASLSAELAAEAIRQDDIIRQDEPPCGCVSKEFVKTFGVHTDDACPTRQHRVAVSSAKAWKATNCRALAEQLAAAVKEIDRLNAQPVRLFDHLAAERMADEIAVLVQRKVISSRCPAADALLDYRNPPQSERSDRLVDLERQIDAERAAKGSPAGGQ